MAKHSNPNCPQGVIVINKHEGVTSYRIVQIMRKMFDTSQVGHTGTLDPMATGVLPVLVGRAVKACDFVTAGEKGYEAVLRLGITTDTEDTTGEILTRSCSIPSENDVLNAVSEMQGDIMQIPPMYSAIKVDGKKLVDLARDGVSIDREPRPVTIKEIHAQKITDTDYKLSVICSKGTYIRTLCADIGAKLGCGGAMASLIRTKSGPFTIDKSYTLEDLENMTLEERYSLVMPTDTLFQDCPRLDVNDFYAKLIIGGTELYQEKTHTTFDLGKRIRIYHKNRFLALGEVSNFENGTAIKPIKLFELDFKI